MGKKICKILFHYADMVKIHGIKMNLSIVSFPGRHIDAHGKGAGEYMSSIVVRMLPDEVHAPRSKKQADRISLAVQFFKFRYQFFSHRNNLHFMNA